jgi:predicted DNA-binding WGR domain protein
MKNSYADQVPLLTIGWTRTGTTMGTVTYTYVKTGDAFNTSFIKYGKQTGKYDAYYTIHYQNGVGFSEVDVQWSTTGHNGTVKCQAFFGDSNFHCWDANYVNLATCP